MLARLWPTSLTGFAPGDSFGVAVSSLLPSYRTKESVRGIISFTLEGRGGGKLTRFSTRRGDFRKFRAIAVSLLDRDSAAISDFVARDTRYTRDAPCKQRDHR